MPCLALTLALAVFAFGIPLPGMADTYDVYAEANGASFSGVTGVATISLTAGQIFTVSVDPSQIWSMGDLPRWSNADGLITNLYATGTDASGQPAGTLIGQAYPNLTEFGLTAPYGALVGEINGVYELLGTSFSGPAWGAGTLYLWNWDNNPVDDTGYVTANVSFGCAVPEPSTYALLACGLGMLGWMGRRRAKNAAT